MGWQRLDDGVVGRVDKGFKEVPVDKIVGSVGRSHNLRSDFFYKTGEAMTLGRGPITSRA